MIRFKTKKASGQISYPDPETNKTVVLLERTGYFYCDEEQAKWLSRFPDLVEVPGEVIPEPKVESYTEKEEPIEEKKSKRKIH